MEKLRCLIVEDEPLAVEVLESYINEIPFLLLVAKADSAMAAMEILSGQEIDLMFLDIHLPRLSGLEMLRGLSHRPKVILCTAYHEYALEGYELEVLDYLLKPIEFSRFVRAVNKARPPKESRPLDIPKVRQEREYRFFNVNKRRVRVYIDEILFIESLREYVRIHSPGGSIVTQFQIGEIEDFLQNGNFMRVHRSFLVARNKIKAFSSSEIEVGNHKIPIGRSYKQLVLQELEALEGGA